MAAKPKEYISITGAANILGVSTTVVDYAVAQGRLPVAAVILPRGTTVFSFEAVAAFKKEREARPSRRGRKPKNQGHKPAQPSKPKAQERSDS